MRSAKLKAGQAEPFELFERPLVAYRTKDGSVFALDGRCPHLGASLAHACVTNSSLKCAFHHMIIGPDGSCLSGLEHGSLRSYPTIEKWGTLWIFNGPKPLFDLPEPSDYHSDFVSMYMGTTHFNCHPHVIAANAFDMSHVDKLHGIDLLAPPIVTDVSPYQIEVEWRGRPSGWPKMFMGGKNGSVLVRNSIVGSLLTWIRILEPLPYDIIYGRRPVPLLAGNRVGSKTQTFLFASRKTLINPGFLSTLVFHTKVLLEDRKLLSDIEFSPHFLPSDGVISALYRHINTQEVY